MRGYKFVIYEEAASYVPRWSPRSGFTAGSFFCDERNEEKGREKEKKKRALDCVARM